MSRRSPIATVCRALLYAAVAAAAVGASDAGEPLRGSYLAQPAPGREPMVFAPGVVSTDDAVELNAVFSPDGREFLFTRRVGEALKIFAMRQDDAGFWSAPEMVGLSRANDRWDEVDMWFAPDGRTPYYISNAPVKGLAAESVNIWRVNRDGARWETPEALPAPVNSDGDEVYPMPVESGNFYFSSTRDGGLGGRDLYVARPGERGFADVSNLGAAVNSAANEGDAYVAPDESYLIVTSNREGGLGRGDLYISFRRPGGDWSEAQHLGAPINSAASDYCPVVTRDGRFFFFSRDGDVYWMDASVLEEPRPTRETPSPRPEP